MRVLYKMFAFWGKVYSKLNHYFINLRFNYLCEKYSVRKGSNIKVKETCPIINCSPKGKIIIGDNVVLNSFHNTSWVHKTQLSCANDGVLSLGNNVGLNGVMIHCKNSITLGDFVHVGGGTRIYDSNFHSIDYLDRRDPIKDCGNARTAPIVIGEDCFIGTNCIIGKGITIGPRCVIAAGSVVVKDIPADSIAGGNPCKVIKTLNQN